MPEIISPIQKDPDGKWQLVVPVFVADTRNPLPPGTSVLQPRKKDLVGEVYRGLIDTGATSTSVAKDLAKRRGFKAIGKGTVATASDPEFPTDVYRLAVVIMESFGGQQSMTLPLSSPDIFEVGEFIKHSPEDVDVLIGMDVIMRSILTINGHERILKMLF